MNSRISTRGTPRSESHSDRGFARKNNRQLSRVVSPAFLVLSNKPDSSLLRATWNWWPACTPPILKASFNIGLRPRVLRMLPEPTTGIALDVLVEVAAIVLVGLIGPVELHAPA